MRNPKFTVLFVIGLLILGSIIYFNYQSRQNGSEQNVAISKKTSQTMVTPSASLRTPTSGANPISLQTQTATIHTVTTVKPKTPSVLFSDQVSLKTNTEGTEKPSSYLFDFDTNRFSSEDSKANDISFGLTNGSSLFLVIKPINGATGIVNDRGTQNSNNNFQDCFELLPEYLKGGKPISEKGAHYCWKTNQGRIVEFTVEKISEDKGLYEVDLIYTVWDAKVN